MVIKSRSVQYMPFLLSFASFGNGCLWTAYGAFAKDVFIIVSLQPYLFIVYLAFMFKANSHSNVADIKLAPKLCQSQVLNEKGPHSLIATLVLQLPNGLGTVLGGVQLLLYGYYKTYGVQSNTLDEAAPDDPTHCTIDFDEKKIVISSIDLQTERAMSPPRDSAATPIC